MTKAPISDLRYADLLKYKDISMFDTSRFPPYQDLPFPDRERLVIHMMNSHTKENAAFHVAKAKTKKPAKPKKDTKKLAANTDLNTTLAQLSTEQLVKLAKMLSKENTK